MPETIPMDLLTPGSSLPVRTKTIAQESLNRYAAVSEDNNPLHLDPEFAAGTQFGGIIAHGMLTLASISEMLSQAFGRHWLETGELKVRFKGAAYVGDKLQTRGKIDKVSEDGSASEIVCSVSVWNEERDQEIISGTAKLQVKKQ